MASTWAVGHDDDWFVASFWAGIDPNERFWAVAEDAHTFNSTFDLKYVIPTTWYVICGGQ